MFNVKANFLIIFSKEVKLPVISQEMINDAIAEFRSKGGSIKKVKLGKASPDNYPISAFGPKTVFEAAMRLACPSCMFKGTSFHELLGWEDPF